MEKLLQNKVKSKDKLQTKCVIVDRQPDINREREGDLGQCLHAARCLLRSHTFHVSCSHGTPTQSETIGNRPVKTGWLQHGGEIDPDSSPPNVSYPH